jgi:hypothetical protein
MLNQNWEQIYDKEDIFRWDWLKNTPAFELEDHKDLVNKLIDKYYRSNVGHTLAPGYNTKQKFRILEKTMDELLEAAMHKEESKPISFRDASVPNPLKKNFDYNGTNWIDRIKEIEELNDIV